MGAPLREAWLWLLLAFVLGLVVGYFVAKRTVREGASIDSAARTRVAGLEEGKEAQTQAAAPAVSTATAGAAAPAAASVATLVAPVVRARPAAKPATAKAPAATAPAKAPVTAKTAATKPATKPATKTATKTATTKTPTKAATTKTPATKTPATKTPVPRKPAAKSAPLDLAAAKAALGTTVKLDDLKLIEGIGPKIEGLFKADGLTTWRAVSKANVERLQGILDAAGPRYTIHNPASWPTQAGLLADGKWAEFKALTDNLRSGR